MEKIIDQPMYPWDVLNIPVLPEGPLDSYRAPSPVRENGFLLWDYCIGCNRDVDRRDSGKQLWSGQSVNSRLRKTNEYWENRYREFTASGGGYPVDDYCRNLEDPDEYWALMTAHAMAHVCDLYRPLPGTLEKRFGKLTELFCTWLAVLLAAKIFNLQVKDVNFPGKTGKLAVPVPELSHFIQVTPTFELGFRERVPYTRTSYNRPSPVDRYLVSLACCIIPGGDPVKSHPEEAVFSYQPRYVIFPGWADMWQVTRGPVYDTERTISNPFPIKRSGEFRVNIHDLNLPHTLHGYIQEVDNCWREREKDAVWLSYDEFLERHERDLFRTSLLPCRDCYLCDHVKVNSLCPPDLAIPKDWSEPVWQYFRAGVNDRFRKIRKAQELCSVNGLKLKDFRSSANQTYKAILTSRRKYVREKLSRSR